MTVTGGIRIRSSATCALSIVLLACTGIGSSGIDDAAVSRAALGEARLRTRTPADWRARCESDPAIRRGAACARVRGGGSAAESGALELNLREHPELGTKHLAHGRAARHRIADLLEEVRRDPSDEILLEAIADVMPA